MYEENGFLVCRYCGTKHLLAKDEELHRESTISLEEDVKRLLKKSYEDPTKAKRYAERVLEIDPHNEEALYLLEKESASKGGCYIATAVYSTYDCPQVWTLRRYRDNTLAETWYGRIFITLYYAVSPILVKWFGEMKWFRKLWKSRLDNMVERLHDEGYECTPYEDRIWK